MSKTLNKNDLMMIPFYRYCIAVIKATKKRKLLDLMQNLEKGNDTLRGQIIPFIHIQEKYWLLWFDCVRNEEETAIITKRQNEGFRRIYKNDLIIETEPEDDKPVITRRSWRSRQKQEAKKPEMIRADLDISDGCSFDLDIGGDLLISDEDTGRDFTGLHFFEHLPGNYRKFVVQPKANVDSAKIALRCFTENPDTSLRTCVRTYEYDVSPEDVKAYFYVEPEPEPEPEVTPEPEPEIVEPVPVVVTPATQDKFVFPQSESFVRLTALTKPPRKSKCI